MLLKLYRTHPAGVEIPGIIMDHFKTQYISLQALPNSLIYDLFLPHLEEIKPKHNTDEAMIHATFQKFGTF